MSKATQRKRAKAQPKNNDAAATATKAAAIFGVQESIFAGRSRVSTLGLQRGVSEMIRRVYALVPGVAPMSPSAPQIKLTYIGQTACAKYEWGRDAKRRLSVAGVINLPACGEADALIPRSVADQYTGYSLHEISHFLFTPLDAFGAEIFNAANAHNVSMDFAKSIINALEDVAIERDLIRSGYAPGAGAMLRGLVEKCIAEVPRSAYGTIKAFPVTLAFCLRGYSPAAQPMIDALPPALRVIYDDAARAMAALPRRAIGDAASIAPVVAVANTVLAALAALRESQPQREPGDMPGDDADGDGEPGDDADGEPGDMPGGEGEPGDGDGADGEGDDGDDTDGDDGEGDADGEPGDGDDTDAMGEKDDARKPGDALPPNPAQPEGIEPDEPAPQPETEKPGEHVPSVDDGAPPGTPPQLDMDSLARGKPISADMQPDMAGEPGDGASGLENDSIRVRVAPDSPGTYGEHVAESVARSLASSAKVAHALRTMLDTSARDSREGGKKNGRLDTSAFARIATGAESVFEKRNFRDGADAAVSILIDQSSSMNMDARYQAARTLAGALSKIIAGCAGVKCEILGFSSGGGAGYAGSMFDTFADELCTDDGDEQLRRSMRGDCCIHVYKTFRESHAHAMARLGSCYGSGGTPDAASITHAAERLAKEPAGQHVLIIIADGEGSPDVVLSRIIRRVERAGIVPIAIGINQDMNEAFTHRTRVDDVRKLNESGLAALLRVLAQGDVAQAMRDGND